MAEDNIRGSLSRKCVYFRNLLTTVCILVVCQASALTRTPVDYSDVLKSRVATIRNDIKQFHDGRYENLFCHHYPVYNDGIVIFVWTSEHETHAMRTCLYQELKRYGVSIVRELVLRTPRTAELCSKTMEVIKIAQNETLIVMSLYSNGLQKDSLYLSEFHYHSGISTVTSHISVRPLTNGESPEQTFVCNSVHVSSKKTGRLQQSFFSFIGNSTEVTMKSTLGSSVSLSLDFDVLVLNAWRLGLLNDSDIDFLFLSDLRVYCGKHDEYELNNETNEITYIDTTDDFVVTTKALIIDDKLLRVQVNASIPNLSGHNFGDYACVTYCKFQTNNSNAMTEGCVQKKILLNCKSWLEK